MPRPLILLRSKVFALAIASLLHVLATPLLGQIPWVWSNGFPQGNTLNAIAYGNGVFVAVGTSGTAITSTDGIAWTVNPSLGLYSMNGVVFANGEFLAVGRSSGSSPMVAKSVDGFHWTTTPSGFRTVSLPNWVTYGNGTYVSVGVGGALQYSTDGSVWSRGSVTPFNSSTLTGVTYGGGKFVAVGGPNASGVILTSDDGAAWTSQTFGSGAFSSVAYGNGQFVAVSQDGKIHTSGDGLAWTLGTANVVSDYGNGYGAIEKFGGISFANGLFLIHVGGAAIFTSTDGIAWTSHLLRTSSTMNATAYGNGRFVAVGSNGAIHTSIDARNWTEKSRTSTGETIYGGAFGGSTYVVVGESGKIGTSTNTTTWTVRTSGVGETLFATAYGGGKFIAVGADGTILSSSNGSSWATRTSNTSALLNDVAYGSGKFVAVGAGGTVLSSADGTTWTAHLAGTPEALTGVAFGNGLYAAVSASGEILTSPNATTWTGRTSGYSGFLADIIFEQGRFVAVGWGGTVLSSTDGIAWTAATPATEKVLNSVIYNAGNSRFIASGAAIGLVSSTDGVIWTKSSYYGGPTLCLVAMSSGKTLRLGPDGTATSTSSSLVGESLPARAFTGGGVSAVASSGTGLKAVAYGKSRFVAVGTDRAILHSPDGMTWSHASSVPNLTAYPPNLYGVDYANGKFVAVGGRHTDTILISLDGAVWTNHSKGTPAVLFAVTCGADRFVAVGEDGKILHSPDGYTWTAATSGTTSNLVSVAYGNGVFVAVDNFSKVLTSSNGVSWTSQTYYAGKSVRFENGMFVAIFGTSIATSPDGVVWKWRGGPSNFVNTTCFGSGLHLGVASGSTFVSRDTTVWYESTPAPVATANIRSIVSDGERFVAVGEAGTILTATLAWPSLAQWRKVFYDTDSNTGNAANDAAPLGDGVKNLIKYALGIDPRENGVPYLPLAGKVFGAEPEIAAVVQTEAAAVSFNEEEFLALKVDRKGLAPGIEYVVEVCGELEDWDAVNVTRIQDTPLVLEVRDNIPIKDARSRFIRLRVAAP